MTAWSRVIAAETEAKRDEIFWRLKSIEVAYGLLLGS